jgi:hypothetical protein
MITVIVREFCATSAFYTRAQELDYFEALCLLEDGLKRTLEADFINPDRDREIFFTER